MPDARPAVTVDDKRRLRRESSAIARKLINTDTVLAGAETLADYRRRFGESDSYFLRYVLPEMFLSDLLNKCCRHQTHQVSYLLNEHLTDFASTDVERNLRGQELAMYRRFGDASGEAQCIRVLKRINSQL